MILAKVQNSIAQYFVPKQENVMPVYGIYRLVNAHISNIVHNVEEEKENVLIVKNYPLNVV